MAVASAGYVAQPAIYSAQPALIQKTHLAPAVAVAQPILKKIDDDFDHHPQYSYHYDIQDGLTGDSKSQSESRDGDVVKGQYSLIDADGFKRTVDYTSDPVNGFNAVVHREPAGAIVKTVAAAPALVKTAPLAYAAAPALVKTAYAAPALLKAAPVAYAQPAFAYHH